MRKAYRIISYILLTSLIQACVGGNNQTAKNTQIDLSKLGRNTIAGWTYGDIKEIKEIEYSHGLGGPSSHRDFDLYRSTGDNKYLFPWNTDHIAESVFIFNQDSTVVVKYHDTKGKKDMETMWKKTYNKDGLLIETISYDVYDKGSLESSKTIYSYNGQSFKSITYNNDGDKTSERSGSIDDDFNVIAEKSNIGDYTYKYDKNKCLIQERLSYTGALILRDDEIIRYQYNEKGLVISEKRYNYNISSGMEKLTTDYHYEYEYDEQGNWIAKYEMTDRGHAVLYTKREITYNQ